AHKSRWRNHHHLIEIAAFVLRPIQDHRCGRNFRQAPDLMFVLRFHFLENRAGLSIDNNGCLRGGSGTKRADEKRNDNKEKAASRIHERKKLSGWTLNAAA